MFGIGVQELILILVVALLVFGPKRLPELARTMGKGLAEFRRASSDLRHSLQGELEGDSDRKEPAAQVAGSDERPAMAGDTAAKASAIEEPESSQAQKHASEDGEAHENGENDSKTSEAKA